MAWNKMNRLHVHVTDSQSWPLEILRCRSWPRRAAYRPDLTYSPHDIKTIIQSYGAQRGVEVYFEIDMPGHIGSVGWSHPELVTAFDAFPYFWWCAEPPCGAFRLNDTAVDKFLDTVMDDACSAPAAVFGLIPHRRGRAERQRLDVGSRDQK